jgi:colicin import membrane protein
VLEQKKLEPKTEPKPAKKSEPIKKIEPDPKIEQRRREDEARQRKEEAAVAAAAERQRQAALQRAMAAAGPTGTTGSTMAGGVGLTDSYRGQVVGCIRPHIAFSVPDGLRPRQHIAEFEVSLDPSGMQMGAPRLLSGSGFPAYDLAVERAIRRCDPFPRPREGAMPRSLRLSFDPVDTR